MDQHDRRAGARARERGQPQIVDGQRAAGQPGGGGQGADPSVIDPGLSPVTLTTSERAQLGAFVAALTAGAAPARPTLPSDLP